VTADRSARAERLRSRLVTHTRRMFGAMLAWTALQAAAAQYEDGQARAQADRGPQAVAALR
jgi:hypothetical protein